MKIVADESVDQQIVNRLRAQGHEVWFVAEQAPGIDDEEVLEHSRDRDAILVTADKDFGELVFRQRRLHSGVVLIRLTGIRPEIKAEIVATAFEQHAQEFREGFAVVSERALRLRRRPA